MKKTGGIARILNPFRNRIGPGSLKKDAILEARVNSSWKHFVQNRHRISAERTPLINRRSRIFCIGSCFALQLKSALRAEGHDVYPKEHLLEIEQPGSDPFQPCGRELVHYNTFTILQEFEKAFGLWRQDDDDFWFVKRQRKDKPPADLYQDPYRRDVYSATREGIVKITRAFDEATKTGILESDLYVITLGLTEVWKKKDNGRCSLAQPGHGGGGGFGQTVFAQSSFKDNHENLKKIVGLVRSRFPKRGIILSVSPVPLANTFSSDDIYVANTESKSVLRAVAGQVSREFEGVYYFPAYEICALFEKEATCQVYEADERHASPPIVQDIIRAFLETYSEESVWEGAPVEGAGTGSAQPGT